MNVHLSNDEFTDHLLGTGQGTTAEHVQACAECGAEAERVARSLNAFKVWVHQRAAAEEPKLNVFSFAERRDKRSFVMWFSASAVLALTLIAFALMMSPTQAPKPAVAQSGSQPDADDALLMEVQQDLDRSVPRALEPAAMLAAERNRVIRETRTRNQ
jgi:hypothetical protein